VGLRIRIRLRLRLSLNLISGPELRFFDNDSWIKWKEEVEGGEED
jgi:hypothetical protein